jgi:penicillin-insensitive murein DD-endopeptidase
MSGLQSIGEGEQKEEMRNLRKKLCLCGLLMLLAAIGHGQNGLADSLAAALGKAELAAVNRAALTQYLAAHADDGIPSKSVGTVSQGSLVHGKLIPFEGENFRYYDTISFLDGRAFVNDRVRRTVLESYQDMALTYPARACTIMECSKPQGGKIWPHRTHQNGLSIDFMVPMTLDGEPFYALDSMGFQHYLLEFNDDGSVPGYGDARIDFDLMAVHLLALQQRAAQNGLKISKVLFKKELLDELLASPHGAALAASHIYFARDLQPLINQLHDNHYHVDFELR